MLKDTSCNLIAEMIDAMSAEDMYEFVVQYGTHEQARTVYPRAGLIEEISNVITQQELLDLLLNQGCMVTRKHNWYAIAHDEISRLFIVSLAEYDVRDILQQTVVGILAEVGAYTPRVYEMLYDYVERHFTNKGENDD